VKLRSVVHRDRLELLRLFGDGSQHGSVHTCSCSRAEFPDDCLSTLAFNECQNAVMTIAANDRVGFPVANLFATIRLRRPLGYMALSRQPAAAILTVGVLSPLFVGTTQISP
jgi:hypothetical protein